MSNPPATPTAQLWTGVNYGKAVRGVLIGQGTNPVAVVPIDNAIAGYALTFNGPDTDPTWQPAGGSTGSGTVTSVALSMPAIFSVGGSPVTTSGSFAVTLATQAANLVWAGPTNGAAASPSFRSLVAADLPAGTGTLTSLTLGWGLTGSNLTTAAVVSMSALTNHGVVLGQGNASVTATAVGSTGQFLMGNSAADPSFQAMTFGFNGYIDPPTNITYPLAYSSAISCTISSINIKCTTGSCTASVTINGVVVTGLSGLTVSSANTAANASAANAVAVNDTIGLSVSNTSSISGLQFTIKATRP